MLLIFWRLRDFVQRCLKVTTGEHLQRLAEVDDEGAGIILDIPPFIVFRPDLQCCDGHGEEQRCSSIITMPVHSYVLPYEPLLGIQRIEKCVPIVYGQRLRQSLQPATRLT